MRWVLGVGLLVLSCACVTPGEGDAGVFGGGSALGGGSPNGGGTATGGGGGADAGFDASVEVDAVWLEAVADDRIVSLTWDAGALVPLSFLILRDGADVTRVAGVVRSYDDLDAPPGSLGSFDASASIGLSTAIEVEWTQPPSTSGPSQLYEVIAELPDAAVLSNPVRVRLRAPTVVDWLISSGDGGAVTSASTLRWVDVDAPAPSFAVTELVTRAIPDDRSSSVALIADASVTLGAADRTYVVTARASAGSNSSVVTTGARGIRVEYQWQRSAADDPANFSDLQYVHGTEWADFDAVLSEGRYYRVAVRANGAEFPSAPARAFLVRPLTMLTSVWTEPWMVREDGLALSLGFQQATAQLPIARQYFLLSSGPGALLFDGGVVAWRGGPGPVAVALPPSDQVAGDQNVICVKVDAGAACDPPLQTTVDTSSLVDLTMVNQDLVCGHLDDAGLRCVSRSGAATDLGPVLAAWLVGPTIVRSLPGGTTVPAVTFGGATLPLEDAGYIAPFHGNACAIREDGFLRCSRYQSNYLSAGLPVSRERVAIGSTMANDYGAGCVLTVSGRVHCRGRAPVVTTPPTPPLVAMMQTRFTGLFLGADRRLDALPTQNQWPAPEIGFDDQLIELNGDWEDVAIMRADRSVAVPTRSWPEPFAMVSGPLGLRPDGGIVNLRSGTTRGPAADAIASLFFDISCARRSGVWDCESLGSFPGSYHHLAGNGSSLCALSPTGMAECRPALGQPWASMRFRDARGGAGIPLSLTTVDGRRFKLLMNGTVTEDGVYDDYLSSTADCGLRRDGTGVCTVPSGVRYPWTGR